MVLSDDRRRRRLFKRSGEGILSALKCLSFQARFSFKIPCVHASCLPRHERELVVRLLNSDGPPGEHFTSAGARSRWMTRGQIK